MSDAENETYDYDGDRVSLQDFGGMIYRIRATI
jgi:hypothetical protein